MSVDTKKVENRRKLHFDTIEDIVEDVENLNQRKVRALGNWSGGQILKHLSIVMNGSIDGAGGASFSWPLRMLGRLMKGRILNKGMSPGYQLKGSAANALVPPAVSWEEGLRIFRDAVRRQQTESKREPSPFLGPMTREQWNQLHCRHAELHLSFLVPE
jgi:Protein of unknown function (DUF1569)